VKPLVEQNALSKKDLDDSNGNERTAQAAVEVARANVLTAELNLGYATIKSPIEGLASFAKVQDGSYLNANSQEALLTTVAALDPMRVNFSVSENEILKYREKIAKGISRCRRRTTSWLRLFSRMVRSTAKKANYFCRHLVRPRHRHDVAPCRGCQPERLTGPRPVCPGPADRRHLSKRYRGATKSDSAERPGLFRLDHG
jgi:hypothetical protein